MYANAEYQMAELSAKAIAASQNADARKVSCGVNKSPAGGLFGTSEDPQQADRIVAAR
jgi:hypothetical protein